MKIQLKMALVFFLLFAAGVGSAFCRQPQTEPVTVQNVKGNIYMVKGGSGANCGFYIGEKEVLVIDAKMSAESARQMLDEIKKLTPKPVTTLIITHSDGDHVNGLGGFPKGLKIIAHPQTKKDMEEAFGKDDALKPLLAYLPTQTFAGSMDLKMGGETIRLLYFGQAHTSGDITVFFPAEKVAFVGDLVFLGRDPLIHKQKGGTSFGLVRNLQALLALDADIYIPGHNDSASKSDIETLMKGIQDKQAKIKAMIQEGKSLDDIKKAFGVESAPGGRRFLSLAEVIYLDLTDKK